MWNIFQFQSKVELIRLPIVAQRVPFSIASLGAFLKIVSLYTWIQISTKDEYNKSYLNRHKLSTPHQQRSRKVIPVLLLTTGCRGTTDVGSTYVLAMENFLRSVIEFVVLYSSFNPQR